TPARPPSLSVRRPAPARPLPACPTPSPGPSLADEKGEVFSAAKNADELRTDGAICACY
ncbi:unnamed protein product, partial [Urochloa humidicola]